MKNDIGIFRFSEDREKPEMSNVAVVTDSNSGITPEMGKELGCYIVPMPFMFGNSDTTYYENVNLTRDQFFDKMESGEVVHTSQPAPNEVLKVWDEALKDHDEVVYIPMSSGLSGSCQSARMLSADYDGKVEVVNNQRISVTQRASCVSQERRTHYTGGGSHRHASQD